MELMCVKTEVLASSCSEADLQTITSVCEYLLDICEITERFDGNMTPSLWKSLLRLVMRNKEVIKNHLQSDRLVSQMCSTLEGKLRNYENLINKDNSETDPTIESLSSKLLKVLKFLAKLLMSFVQSFQDFLFPSTFKDITRLIFSIISVYFERIMKPSGAGIRNDTSTSLIITLEPFLKILVLNKTFADLLTRRNPDILPSDNVSRCYTLSNIVPLLPVISEEISSYWIKPDNYSESEPRVSIYEALLESCDACFVEMSFPIQVPGAMCNGKPQRMISLYEYVVSRLSASISAIPSQYFKIIEDVLLKSVFERTVIGSSIATDVWCFMARWMTADLCYSHTKLFLLWLSNVSWKTDLQKNRLRTLVRRLLPLVSEGHQELLLQEYPPDSIENFQIWATVPVHKMIEAVRMQVVCAITQLSNSLLNQWLDQKLPQFELEKILRCLENLVTHPVIFRSLGQDVKSDFIITTMRLLSAFLDHPKETTEFCWSHLVNILKALLPLIQCRNFNKVLTGIAKTVEVFRDDILCLYFARLLADCGNLPFPYGQDESTLISKIFRTLITSKHWLVHNEAFTALRRFAEVTPYTPVLEQCVPDEIKEDFKRFICAIPYAVRLNDNQNILLLTVLREQATLVRPEKVCPSPEFLAPVDDLNKDLDKRKREVTDDESDPKRSKIDTGQMSKEDENLLSSTVEELWKNLVNLQELHSRNAHFPDEIWEKLRSLKTLLNAMVKTD